MGNYDTTDAAITTECVEKVLVLNGKGELVLCETTYAPTLADVVDKLDRILEAVERLSPSSVAWLSGSTE